MPKIDFLQVIEKEMELVEKQLYECLENENLTLHNASSHLVKAGGKRLRPAFTLLTARIFIKSLENIIPMAVALELVHLASLVHDDVIDNSKIRRGHETVKSCWGNRVSIYAGNYILANALNYIAEYERKDVLDYLADTSMKICEGEITQMLSTYDTEQSLKDYLRRIERKTALLISASCNLGAMLSNAEEDQIMAAKKYGYYLGMAFQITDDILDFIADEEVLGKATGSDIRQGIITLPAIYALKHDSRKSELKRLLSSPELCVQEAEQIIDIVTSSDGIEYAYQVSIKYAQKAQAELLKLPDVEEKQIFFDICDFIIQRDF